MASFSGVTFVLFCFVFVFNAFVEAAALRLIVLRYAGAPIAIRVSLFFSFCLCGDGDFFRVFFVPLSFSFCMESASYVLSFRMMVFFYLVTTGYTVYISCPLPPKPGFGV